ncbi:hypothetical protein DL770_011034 [Monosporascus sp. CRB-9-2]|nr:hypothetical protein DL770_011034 [Monosporascus sp. CRB-9-2]
MLSERIETILRETGTKIGALGEVAGVSSGTASMWLTGQIKSIKLHIQALALRVGALSSQRRARIESIISACLVDAEQLDKLEAIEQGSNPVLAAEGARLAAIANAAGVSKALVEHWLSGHVQKIRLEHAIGIQDRYGYNAIWIVLGRGPRELSTSSISDLREEVQSFARRAAKLSPASFAKLKGHLADYEKVDAYDAAAIAATKDLINAA